MFRPSRLLMIIGLCCLTLFLVLAGWLHSVGDLARRATLPAVRFVSKNAAAVFLSRSSSNVSLSPEEVRTLESRLTRLAVDYTRLKALEEENKALRLQTKFLTSSEFDSVGAHIISRDLRDERALLLIDRGLQDHLEIGQAVITDEGIFIGKIYSLKERVATVELFTDPHSRVAAALAGEQRLIGVVEGRGNGAARLTYSPSSEKIQTDQIVVTANTQDKVPQNLPLGIVNAVLGKPTDPFLSAAIEPLVHLNQISLVSVLRPSVFRSP
ncbi:MAG: rod shape-determining protein MreC [Candidatus Uhrbacteria bacterium]|nr:rod shape-determining protein MreC [Candidatus Uhrbacteria bacterium]